MTGLCCSWVGEHMLAQVTQTELASVTHSLALFQMPSKFLLLLLGAKTLKLLG